MMKWKMCYRRRSYQCLIDFCFLLPGFTHLMLRCRSTPCTRIRIRARSNSRSELIVSRLSDPIGVSARREPRINRWHLTTSAAALRMQEAQCANQCPCAEFVDGKWATAVAAAWCLTNIIAVRAHNSRTDQIGIVVEVRQTFLIRNHTFSGVQQEVAHDRAACMILMNKLLVFGSPLCVTIWMCKNYLSSCNRTQWNELLDRQMFRALDSTLAIELVPDWPSASTWSLVSFAMEFATMQDYWQSLWDCSRAVWRRRRPKR